MKRNALVIAIATEAQLVEMKTPSGQKTFVPVEQKASFEKQGFQQISEGSRTLDEWRGAPQAPTSSNAEQLSQPSATELQRASESWSKDEIQYKGDKPNDYDVAHMAARGYRLDNYNPNTKEIRWVKSTNPSKDFASYAEPMKELPVSKPGELSPGEVTAMASVGYGFEKFGESGKTVTWRRLDDKSYAGSGLTMNVPVVLPVIHASKGSEMFELTAGGKEAAEGIVAKLREKGYQAYYKDEEKVVARKYDWQKAPGGEPVVSIGARFKEPVYVPSDIKFEERVTEVPISTPVVSKTGESGAYYDLSTEEGKYAWDVELRRRAAADESQDYLRAKVKVESGKGSLADIGLVSFQEMRYLMASGFEGDISVVKSAFHLGMTSPFGLAVSEDYRKEVAGKYVGLLDEIKKGTTHNIWETHMQPLFVNDSEGNTVLNPQNVYIKGATESFLGLGVTSAVAGAAYQGAKTVLIKGGLLASVSTKSPALFSTLKAGVGVAEAGALGYASAYEIGQVVSSKTPEEAVVKGTQGAVAFSGFAEGIQKVQSSKAVQKIVAPLTSAHNKALAKAILNAEKAGSKPFSRLAFAMTENPYIIDENAARIAAGEKTYTAEEAARMFKEIESGRISSEKITSLRTGLGTTSQQVSQTEAKYPTTQEEALQMLKDIEAKTDLAAKRSSVSDTIIEPITYDTFINGIPVRKTVALIRTPELSLKTGDIVIGSEKFDSELIRSEGFRDFVKNLGAKDIVIGEGGMVPIPDYVVPGSGGVTVPKIVGVKLPEIAPELKPSIPVPGRKWEPLKLEVPSSLAKPISYSAPSGKPGDAEIVLSITDPFANAAKLTNSFKANIGGKEVDIFVGKEPELPSLQLRKGGITRDIYVSEWIGGTGKAKIQETEKYGEFLKKTTKLMSADKKTYKFTFEEPKYEPVDELTTKKIISADSVPGRKPESRLLKRVTEERVYGAKQGRPIIEEDSLISYADSEGKAVARASEGMLTEKKMKRFDVSDVESKDLIGEKELAELVGKKEAARISGQEKVIGDADFNIIRAKTDVYENYGKNAFTKTGKLKPGKLIAKKKLAEIETTVYGEFEKQPELPGARKPVKPGRDVIADLYGEKNYGLPKPYEEKVIPYEKALKAYNKKIGVIPSNYESAVLASKLPRVYGNVPVKSAADNVVQVVKMSKADIKPTGEPEATMIGVNTIGGAQQVQVMRQPIKEKMAFLGVEKSEVMIEPAEDFVMIPKGVRAPKPSVKFPEPETAMALPVQENRMIERMSGSQSRIYTMKESKLVMAKSMLAGRQVKLKPMLLMKQQNKKLLDVVQVLQTGVKEEFDYGQKVGLQMKQKQVQKQAQKQEIMLRQGQMNLMKQEVKIKKNVIRVPDKIVAKPNIPKPGIGLGFPKVDIAMPKGSASKARIVAGSESREKVKLPFKPDILSQAGAEFFYGKATAPKKTVKLTAKSWVRVPTQEELLLKAKGLTKFDVLGKKLKFMAVKRNK